MFWKNEKTILTSPQNFILVVEAECSHCGKVSTQAKLISIPGVEHMTYMYCPRCGDRNDA